MKRTQNFFKTLLFSFCIWIYFPCSSSELISLCQRKDFSISCNLGQYIVIKNASLGHLPYLDRININNSRWCKQSSEYFKLKNSDCIKSLWPNIAFQCNGQTNCKLNIVPSEYLLPKEVLCELFDNETFPMSLYIDYFCVPKDLFYSPEHINHKHIIGGYITSFGYFEQKKYNDDSLKELVNYYRANGFPLMIHRNWDDKPHLMQLKIIENSLSLYTNSSSKTCQVGQPFDQDYYAFNFLNETGNNNSKLSTQLVICPAKPNMIGQIFGPIMARQINITINVNFSSSVKRMLLVKFTKIVCSPIEVNNAIVSYDHVIETVPAINVIVIATISCNTGFFLSSLSYPLKKINSEIIGCNQNTGLWNKTIGNCVFVLHNLTQSSSPSYTEVVSVSTNDKTEMYSTITQSYDNVISSTEALLVKTNIFKYLVPVLLFLLVIGVLLLFLIWKFKDKIKCLQNPLDWYYKLKYKNGGFPHTHHLHYKPACARDSLIHTFVYDDQNPMADSFMSANGSCRQSNRTLITMTDSRPTVGSGEFMQTSNYISDYELNELPTKVQKPSTLTRLMRSASSLRNSSLRRQRPKSLSRQSFTDRNSNYSDPKYSGSQVPLLSSKRSHLTPEFLDSNPMMCSSNMPSTSNMTKSDVLQRRNRPFSQYDVAFKSKMNNKVISPTVDTYLEPTGLSTLVYESPEETRSPVAPDNSSSNNNKSSDYMIYDHSRMSSNNVDNTCQSSVIASLSDDNANDDDRKRFSMISNNYYGMHCAEPRNNQQPITSNLDTNQYKSDSNSNESLYESIDGDNMPQRTIDRRHIALPPPPIED